MSENIPIGQRWFEEVWGQRRAASIYEMMAPDCVAHAADGDLIGPEQWEQMQRDFLKVLPDVEFTVEAVVSSPTQSVVRWAGKGTHTGEAPGMPPTNQEVRFHGTTWMRLKDDRIVEGWDLWDQTKLLQTLRSGAFAATEVPGAPSA